MPSGEIKKHKDRICAHGGMQKWGESYYETYSPVVNWLSVRFLMTMDMALDLETKSIDLTIACPQVVLKTDKFMEILWGCSLDTTDSQHTYCLKFLRNLHGLKDRGCDLFECLKGVPLAHGFNQS